MNMKYLIIQLLSISFFLAMTSGCPELDRGNVPDPEIHTDWSTGAVIDADSGTPADLKKALELAVPGDTIRIPAGIFIFDEAVYMDAGVRITGAGSDQTILVKSGSFEQPFITVDGSNGLTVFISDMKMTGDQTDNSDQMDDGILLNSCRDFRITQIVFESFGESGVSVNGNARGVIDNCRFINIYRPPIGNFGYGVRVYGDGDAAWARPFILGDLNTVFIEDCFFKGNRHCVAANNGARYVFRYNQVEDNGGEGQWVQAVDAHGPGYGSSRGTRCYEVYNNTIDNIHTVCWVAMYIRGGDGVIFNNNISGGISTAPIMLYNDSAADSYPALDQIRELYMWDNYYEGAPTFATNWTPRIDPDDENSRVAREGRDFFNFKRPGYKPYTYPHTLREND